MSLISIKTKLQKSKFGNSLLKIYHLCYAVPMSEIIRIKYKLERKNYKKISYFQDNEVFDMLREKKMSLCRFGDGEIAWIYKKSKGYFGQENSEQLSASLKKVIESNDEQILIGIPKFFGDMEGYDERRKKSREVHLASYGKKWMRLLDENKKYADALITRVYLGRVDINYKAIFDSWKRVWGCRKVVIVEGAETRFGVGNDLLENARSVERIIAPAENAFTKYGQIYETAKSYNKDVLFLIALGPTATIMVYDLSFDGYQAIDIGHLDIEYEWFLSGVEKKTPVAGKYVNEAGGMPMQSIACDDETKYKSEIAHQCDT